MRPSRRQRAEAATAHQERLIRRRAAYCRALARANRGLSYEDCEEVFAETLASDALGLPAELSPREAHQWFSRRLQQRAIDFIRHRDGRRESEKQRRLRTVSLDAPAGEDVTDGLAGVIADPTVDVAAEVEAGEARRQAIAAATQAMSKLKPHEQRILKLRYELPDAGLAELGGLLGLTVDQANYRLRTASRKFKRALAAGRLGPECDVARAALRSGGEPSARARAEAHVEGCLMCRAWALQHAVLAWLPFPAFTRLEWLVARLEERWRPFAPLPDTAAGAGAAGGTAIVGGAGAKIAAMCSAAAVCAGVAWLPETAGTPSPRERPVPLRQHKPRPVAATPTATPAPRATATPGPARARTPQRSAPTTTAPDATEFEPGGAVAAASTARAPAPATGGTEFTP